MKELTCASNNSKVEHFVGDTAKGRISKQVFQENKARQIFRKTNIFYPLIRTRTCAYQGVKNNRFWFFGKFQVLCFLETPVLRFSFFLITNDLPLYIQKTLYNSKSQGDGNLARIIESSNIRSSSSFTKFCHFLRDKYLKMLFGTLVKKGWIKNIKMHSVRLIL